MLHRAPVSWNLSRIFCHPAPCAARITTRRPVRILFKEPAMPANADEDRKQQFAALSSYMEQKAERCNREMPGSTEKQKGDALVSRMTVNLDEARRKKLVESLAAVLSGKILKRVRNQSDRDYSGGGFYNEQSE